MNKSFAEKLTFDISDDGNIVMGHENSNRYVSLNKKEKIDNKNIRGVFNELSTFEIRNIINDKENNQITIVFKDFKANQYIELSISNYKILKKQDYSKKLIEKIRKFNLGKIVNKAKKFVDLKTIIVAGSIVSASTIIAFADNTVSFENTSSYDNIDTLKNTNDDPTTETFEDSFFTDSNMVVDENMIPEMEITISDSKIDTNTTQNNDGYLNSNNYVDEIKNEKADIDFSELKDYTDYSEYMKFASKLFDVDFNEAKLYVQKYINAFYNNDDSNYNLIEMNRMKNLKDKGLINGDLNVMAIFIATKDYAYKNGLGEREPIISDKTADEREKDIVYVGKYIYGASREFLEYAAATYRIETAMDINGRAISDNNLGGNKDDNGVFNKYYRTEQGAESMFRNFIEIYDKCLNDSSCTYYDNIAYFIRQKYCPAPEELWAEKINDILDEGFIGQRIDNYLNENSKTY